MKHMDLIKRLKNAYLIRCRYWGVCGRSDCDHYEPHRSVFRRCIGASPYKYCSKIHAFVHDMALEDIDPEAECDPNLAFKAKRAAAEEHTTEEDVPNPNSHSEYMRWKEERGFIDDRE